jgi:ribosome-binding factor A
MAAKRPRFAKPTAAGPRQRQLRVGEEIRHVLAGVFERGAFRDPALQDINVTVTEVRVSPDLKHATAFVMPLAGRNAPEAIAGLRRGAAFLRMEVARAVKLRAAPTLTFALDESFEQANRIETILRRDDVARDLSQDGTDDGA